jgi:hypothetical protein
MTAGLHALPRALRVRRPRTWRRRTGRLLLIALLLSELFMDASTIVMVTEDRLAVSVYQGCP